MSNTPITDVSSNAIRCNAGTSPVLRKCAVTPGSTVTVEMHQQPNDRSCGSQAIGGAHYGPVTVYLSKVPDSSTADGASDWFKVFEVGWKANPSGGSGDDDMWGTKDLNTCCGKMDVPLPADLAAGDYLLRAEALALHTAGAPSGAQFYVTCYQLQVGGSSGAGGTTANASALALSTPYQTVKFPGAYSARDPGILVNIHAKLPDYVVPGPPVVPGGTTRVAGSACTGCESTCKAGSGPTGTALVVAAPTAAAGDGSATVASCAVAAYGQCGGTGYTGCASCAVSLRDAFSTLCGRLR